MHDENSRIPPEAPLCKSASATGYTTQQGHPACVPPAAETVVSVDLTVRRCRFDLRGQVQGVGFRPYVYRLAGRWNLAGYVANNMNGAVIEVEGPAACLEGFARELLAHLPPLARVSELHRQDLAPLGESEFRIRASDAESNRRPEVVPDAATCADCLRELFSPQDRRYRYPFINCTNCGPRYSIIRDLPYDRPQTTMAAFKMCTQCDREYHDPRDRRFHAQPNACPACGPSVSLRAPSGLPFPTDDPIRTAAAMLRSGAIVAVKGIGGYHLACRADLEATVQRLRQRKLRDGKPLAVMVPDLDCARRLCRLCAADEEALTSVAAPIVLAPKADEKALAPSVAPGCRDFGLMLPYAPVHHLLFAEGLGPLVMTSANLAGQPLTYRDDQALADLADVADAFLVHNREIFRPIDDSVVFTYRGQAIPIRRARGYAPRPIHLALRAFAGSAGRVHPTDPAEADPARVPRILAVGGELKSTVCLLDGPEAILSEHLGDLTRPETFRHFLRAIERLCQLCDFTPESVACDLHPRYLATEYAQRLGLPVVGVQHHHAHIASVMAEWGDAGPVVGIACDGTGYGTDGAIWGCEVLVCHRGDFERAAHLAYFPLAGGDLAALETWRPAAALVREALGSEWIPAFARLVAGRWPALPAPPDGLDPKVLCRFDRQVAAAVNAPLTSSLGRVFDAVAFLLGLCAINRHEAEAAMALEAAAASEPPVVPPLPYELVEADGVLRVHVAPAIRAILDALDRAAAVPQLAAQFHETVARALTDAALQVARRRGIATIALSGGCFANRRLLARTVDLLEAKGVNVLYNRNVPAGDGGLSLGQAWVARWRLLAD